MFDALRQGAHRQSAGCINSDRVVAKNEHSASLRCTLDRTIYFHSHDPVDDDDVAFMPKFDRSIPVQCKSNAANIVHVQVHTGLPPRSEFDLFGFFYVWPTSTEPLIWGLDPTQAHQGGFSSGAITRGETQVLYRNREHLAIDFACEDASASRSQPSALNVVSQEGCLHRGQRGNRWRLAETSMGSTPVV
jgi:hypothetical protein